MKLSSITIRGIHKVTNKTYDLSGFRYFFGENGAGKSTVMQAVQLALLGYIPGTDKTKSAIFKHSDGRAMSVELTVDDGGKPITITRTWEKKGKDVVANSSVSPAVYDTKGIVGNLELPVFNFNEFVGMTANKLKDWFMNFLPPADAEIDWNYELSNSIADFGKILDQEFFNETIRYVKDLANRNSGVALVREFNTYLKEQLSAYKATQTRIQATIQNLVYYNDCDESQSIDELTQANNEAQIHLDNLHTNLLKVQQNMRLAERLESIKHHITASSLNDASWYMMTSLNEDSWYTAAKIRLNEYEKSLAVLENRKLMIEKQVTELSAELRDKKKIAESNGKCPYTCEGCATIANLITVFKNEMEKLREKINELTAQIAEIDREIRDMNNTINSERVQMAEVEKAYSQYDLVSSQMSIDVKGITVEELTSAIEKLETEINNRRDIIIKLKANKKYEELTDKLANEKYTVEQNIEILKVWCKLTDVNGLQSKLMKAPFDNLADKMSEYICKFFDGTGRFKSAAFMLTEKANSFSFGVTDSTGTYIEFDLLSSGEKCLYTLAMLLCIVEVSDSPLKLIMIDDLLDHLDTARIKDCFKTLYSIRDIQILLAGVQPCTHENAEEFVIQVN